MSTGERWFWTAWVVVMALLFVVNVSLRISLRYWTKRAEDARAERDAIWSEQTERWAAEVLTDPRVADVLDHCRPEHRVQVEAAVHIECAWLTQASDDEIEAWMEAHR